MTTKFLLILTGPTGAGKTHFAIEFMGMIAKKKICRFSLHDLRTNSRPEALIEQCLQANMSAVLDVDGGIPFKTGELKFWTSVAERNQAQLLTCKIQPYYLSKP